MSQPLTTGSQIRIFVGNGAHGIDGAEPIVNAWLANNPLIEVKDIQTALTGSGSIVVTVWFHGLASN